MIVIMLPLVSLSRQPASYVFTAFVAAPESTGISSKAYAAVLALLVSQYSLYGYDAAAHLTEETRGAEKNGPIAILSSIGIISVFGWAYILALTFSIQVFILNQIYKILDNSPVVMLTSACRILLICTTRLTRLPGHLCQLRYSMMHFMAGTIALLEQ